VTGDGPRQPEVNALRVRLSLGSTLMVIGAVAAALILVGLFEAARRPVAWVVATAVVAWLLSWVIDVLDRWMPRGLAVLVIVVGFVVLAGGGWLGVRATIRSEVARLRTGLPDAARDLEQRYGAVADFRLAERTQAFVNSLDERFGTQAQVTAAAGTASTYIVTGVLMLFLLGYGPRFVSAGLRQIGDPARRASVTAVLGQASSSARAYLLIALAQVIAVTAICSVVFYLLDLPAPFVLGLLVGWLSAIPYLGVILGGLAPLLAAATEPHQFTYLVLVGLLVGLQLVEAWVIRPRVDRSTLRVGPALMLVGTIVGFELYGFGGALYGTAVLVLLWALLNAMPVRSALHPAAEGQQREAEEHRADQPQGQLDPLAGGGERRAGTAQQGGGGLDAEP
jgi:putative heme transporter